MLPKTGSASAICASPFKRTRRKRLRSLYAVFPTILLGIVIVAGVHVGIAAAPSHFSDLMTDRQTGPDSGDAPNSSVCRKALKQATIHSAKCDIARDFRGCRFDSGFIPYLEFQYCLFHSPVLPTVLMVLWLFVLLGAFAVIADSFFSPSLIALARSMHMSQNLAGVTLLAFGNGAPDVFSAVTAITTGDPSAPDEGLGLGFLMGSGLLVNTVTAGLIMIIKPFRTNRRPFVKDVLFYMSAVSWSAIILIRRSINLRDSVGFTLLYILYVITTWAASHIRLKKSNTEFYRRCATRLRNLKDQFSCKRDIPNADSAIDNETRPSLKSSWWKRFKNLFRSRRATISIVDVEDAESGSKKTTGSQSDEKDVKFIGFRRKHDPLTIPKRSSDGRPRTSPQRVPRIEVTGPPTDVGTTGRSSSLTKSSFPTPKRETLAPPKDLHLLSQHQRQSLTPQPPLAECATPPVSISRWNSAVGESHSITAGFSSFRKRASVGGIGLRSRTSSFYQSRRSRRTSTMEQLPFVVRWIIANEEAENEEIKSGHLEAHRRHRNISDPTQAEDISDCHTFTQDVSQSRSPTVTPRSFLRGIHVHQQSHGGSGRHRLQRISSVSLPDLEDADKAGHDVHFSASANTSSRTSLADRQPEVRIITGAAEKLVDQGKEKSVEEEDEDEEKTEYIDPFLKWASKSMWHHLLYALCPVEISEWHELSIPIKVIQIIQAPIFLLFRLTIPVVYEDLEPTPSATRGTEIQISEDGERDRKDGIITATSSNGEGDVEVGVNADISNNLSPQLVTEVNEETTAYVDFPYVDIEELHGWCRLLNCFQCLITPMLWVLLITVGGMPLGLYKVGSSNLPIVVIVSLVSCGLAITIFVTSRWDRAPTPYHRPFFAILGFLTSIVWIYAIAHELVNSLEALGIVWEISEAILGITVMAFANSISDLMSNSLLAHNGYPRIAFAACIGSPLFNLLVGAGASYTIKLARSGDHTAEMSFTLTHALLFSFLMGVLLMDLIVAFMAGFKMSRVYGVILLTTYAIFMVLAILVEADVIVPPTQWRLLTGTE